MLQVTKELTVSAPAYKSLTVTGRGAGHGCDYLDRDNYIQHGDILHTELAGESGQEIRIVRWASLLNHDSDFQF